MPEHLQSHKLFLGDRPSLSILFEGALSSYNCGQLLALYEHRIAIEGFIYGINSFDQWGVELGKALAQAILPELESPTTPTLNHDSSTNNLIRRFRKMKG